VIELGEAVKAAIHTGNRWEAIVIPLKLRMWWALQASSA
jgi:hypothetical protein